MLSVKKITRDVIQIIVITIAISMIIYVVLDYTPIIRASREIEVFMFFIEIAIVAIVIVFILKFDSIVARFFKK